VLDVKASFVLDKGSLTERVERISRSSGQEPIAAIRRYCNVHQRGTLF